MKGFEFRVVGRQREGEGVVGRDRENIKEKTRGTQRDENKSRRYRQQYCPIINRLDISGIHNHQN